MADVQFFGRTDKKLWLMFNFLDGHQPLILCPPILFEAGGQ